MSKSKVGGPTASIELSPRRIAAGRRHKARQLRSWQRKNGPVEVAQLERCPQCRQWMRDEHRC